MFNDQTSNNETYDETYNENYNIFDEEINSIISRSVVNIFSNINNFSLEDEANLYPNNSTANDYYERDYEYDYDYRRVPMDIYSLINSLVNREEEIFQEFLNETFLESVESATSTKSNESMIFLSKNYGEIEQKEKYEKSCSICLSDYDKDSDVSFLNCNHLFHTNCISEWSMYKKTCPICRNNIDSDKKE
jgi:hypothetical protein